MMLLQITDALGFFSTAEPLILKLQWIILGLMIVSTIISIAILWNQQKIKKMLREMQAGKKDEGDKP